MLVPALGIFFLLQLVESHDPFATWQEDAEILLRTGWGRTWSCALAVTVVAILGFAAARTGRHGGPLVGTLAALGVACLPALTGHASGSGSLRPLTVAADILHTWAACAWVGGSAWCSS